MSEIKMKSKVWVYPGMAAWRFLTLPKKESGKIKKLFGGLARGWGSLPVLATIGKTAWKTSIFPDKKAGAYLLPLKAEVRKKEGITDGANVIFVIKILM
jgi:hypothetical protein